MKQTNNRYEKRIDYWTKLYDANNTPQSRKVAAEMIEIYNNKF